VPLTTPETDDHPADWRADWARALVAVFSAAYLVHAIAVVSTHRHLFGDASQYLVRILSEGAVTEFFHNLLSDFYYSRYFAFLLTQGPTVAAIKLGVSHPEKLSLVYGCTFLLWKLASVPVSLWLLPRGREAFVIFPILGILAGTINSELYLVSEIHISSAAFWPLLFAFVWLPDEPTWRRTVCIGAATVITSFLYESMALLLLVPLAVVASRLATGRPDPVTRRKLMLLAALLVLGSLMNFAAVAFPRDAANRGGVAFGVYLLLVDTLAGTPFLHAGPTVSVACLALLVLAVMLRGPSAKVIAWLGAAALALWPAAHFLVYRQTMDYAADQANDRGFSGGAMQLALVALFFAALRFRPVPRRKDALCASILIAGLLTGQLSWQLLATKAWTETTSLVRHVLATQAGPVDCVTVSDDLRTVSPTIDQVLWSCGWWVTPLSIILAPDRNVRALLVSRDRYAPFDPLNPRKLPSMQYAPVDYNPYLRHLGPAKPMGRGDRVEFTRKGDGWLATRSGFSFPEDWGTWAVARAASLELCVDPKAANDRHDVHLKFKLAPFVPPARPDLAVVVLADGRKVADWSFAHPEVVTQRDLDVPAALFRDGCARIELRISDLASPASLGLGADRRPLGIALIEIAVAD
jgi:hypothetical protein